MIKEQPIALFEPIVDITNHMWITARRERILVKEMRTSHIKNCIKAFKTGRIPRNYLGGKAKWNEIFKNELINRQ